MGEYHLDYSQFSELIQKFEALGVSADEIGTQVLEEAAPAAVEAFRMHVPYDATEKDNFHARDHVRASAIKTGKSGKYKVIGVFDGDGAKMDWSIAKYLFMVENGTSKMAPRPFTAAAAEAATEAAVPAMEQSFTRQITERLGG